MTGSLTTPWSQALGLRAPVVNAPMGGVAGGRLAAAVSAAGGLGMVGIGSAGSVALLEREVAHPRRAGVRFGIGLLDWVLAREPGLLDAAVAAGPAVVSVSFGDDWAWVRQVREAGILTATQVSDVASARRAAEAGIDLVVARGAEGGGHGEPAVGTLPLLAAVLEAVTVPVLAAGGISSPRGLAAVLAAGASGAWVGTAFAGCPESLATDAARTVLLDAGETDTVLTSAFDVALGYPWPARFPERVVRNSFSDRWAGHAAELAADDAARAALAEAIGRGDHRLAHVDAGQGVGMLDAVRPAGEVLDWLCSGAARLLGTWAHLGAGAGAGDEPETAQEV